MDGYPIESQLHMYVCMHVCMHVPICRIRDEFVKKIAQSVAQPVFLSNLIYV
jgi:hypothetical protein